MRERCRKPAGKERPRQRPSHARLSAIVLAALLLAAPIARAQFLNLDTPGLPAPGEGKAALALADRMKTRIEQAPAGEPGSMRQLSARFTAEICRLARLLALRGEDLGEPGSPHLVAAQTLASGLPQIESLAARIGDTGDAALVLAVEQFLQDQSAWAADEAAARNEIPADPRELDRFLRDRLALIVESLPVTDPGPPWRDALEHNTAGWVRDAGPAATPDEIETLFDFWSAAANNPFLTDQLRAFRNDVLLPAESLLAFRAQSRGITSLLIRAGRAISDLPEWVPHASRDQWWSRFAAAAAALTERATQDRALDDLRRIIQDADTVARLAAAGEGAPTALVKPITSARTALLQAAAAESPSELAAVVDRAATLILRRKDLGQEPDLARELRPAWRILDLAAKRTEADLWTALARLSTTTAAPASDPAIVGALAAHARALDDLRAARALGRALNDASLLSAPEQRMALARALRLSQDLGKQDKHDATLTVIRASGDDFNDLLTIRAETDLLAAAAPAPEENPAARAAWSALTGNRAGELATAIDTARRKWLADWAAGREGPSAARLRALHDLLTILADAVAVHQIAARAPGPGREGIQAWPGWELSDTALKSLLQSVSSTLARATDAAITTDDAGLAGALKQLDTGGRRPILHLLATLDDAARARPILPVPELVEVACPPAADGWLQGSRADLAAICRYLEEFADAMTRGDTKRADRLLAIIAPRAEVVARRTAP